jgi:hypothetical protein
VGVVSEIDHGLETTGLDRRSVLRRGAMLGGALVWTAPVVQSLSPAASAGADGSPPDGGGGGAPSFTMLVLQCGQSRFSVKIDQDGSFDCGAAANGNGAPAHAAKVIDNQLGAGTWASLKNSDCFPGFDTTIGATGLRVDHGTCAIIAWAVHDGAGAGCGKTEIFGPGNGGAPAYSPSIGVTSSTFPKPAVDDCPTPTSL